MRKKYYYIYKITNKINGKIYIGVHQTTDLNDNYIGSGKILKRAIEKYGIENFEKEILQFFESKEEMFEAESILVNEEFIKREDTYNIKEGGFGGWDYINNESLNNKNKDYINLSNKLKNRYVLENIKNNNPEFYYKILKKSRDSLKKYYTENKSPFLGKNHTRESKIKIGKANSIHQKGSGNSNYGKCWIYNEILKECKIISKEDLERFLTEGWKKGRKMKNISE